MKRKPTTVIVLLLLLCLCTQTAAAADTLSSLPEHDTTTRFAWPAPDSRHITSTFGNRTISLYGYERFHTGIDINAATGSPVVAAEDGTVIVSVYDGGWGNYIMINHGDNLITLYAHLNERHVEVGQSVLKGEQIGTTGNSGLSSGPHLHFEVRVNGKSTEPFLYSYE